jgi:ubiquinone biosynthesis protein Coq4
MHILVERKNYNKLIKKLQEVPEVRHIIQNKPSAGARLSTKHLF